MSFNKKGYEIQDDIKILKAKLDKFKHKFLFSLDNMRHLEGEDHEKFLKFLIEISSDHVKVAFTSSKFNPEVFEGTKFMCKKI